MSSTIHPSAFISKNAKLGSNVTIGPCAVIDDNVEIGDGCQIDAFASIKQHTTLGKNNHVFSYAMVGEVPQDLKFAGEVTHLKVGDNNRIREFTSIHRGTAGGGGITQIGNDCLIMAYSHIAHDCILGDNIVLSNGATLAGHVLVGDNAILGGLSAIHQFVRVGNNAFLGGKSGLSMDLPPYMLASGERGLLYGPNLVGLRRLGLGKEIIASIKSAFKTIWLSGANRQDALDEVEKAFPSCKEVKEIVDFVRTSQRGVIHAAHNSMEE